MSKNQISSGDLRNLIDRSSPTALRLTFHYLRGLLSTEKNVWTPQQILEKIETSLREYESKGL